MITIVYGKLYVMRDRMVVDTDKAGASKILNVYRFIDNYTLQQTSVMLERQITRAKQRAIQDVT